jgi:hypothetical protein
VWLTEVTTPSESILKQSWSKLENDDIFFFLLFLEEIHRVGPDKLFGFLNDLLVLQEALVNT